MNLEELRQRHAQLLKEWAALTDLEAARWQEAIAQDITGDCEYIAKKLGKFCARSWSYEGWGLSVHYNLSSPTWVTVGYTDKLVFDSSSRTFIPGPWLGVLKQALDTAEAISFAGEIAVLEDKIAQQRRKLGLEEQAV